MKPGTSTTSQAGARSPARWVGYGLGILLLTLLSRPAPAQTVSIRASVGWDGWIRSGAWNPLTVEVRTDVPVSGWLVVDLPQEFGRQRLRLRHPVALPPGGAASWHLAVFLQDARRPVRVSVTTEEGKELAVSEVSPQLEGAVASIVGYLGPQPPTPPRELRGGGRRVVARLREEFLPESPAAYTSLDLLVVEELDERRMNEAQRRAIQAWVLHGGRMVVASALDRTSPLARWLAVARPRIRSVEAPQPRSVSGPTWDPKPTQGAQSVVERSRVVAWWAPRGLGRVYVWAAPPHQVSPDSSLWSLALPLSSPREPPPEPESNAPLPLGTAAVGLGMYMGLWVLAVALAGRTPWGWLVVAAVLAAGGVGMPSLADEVRRRSGELHLQRVEVAVEGSSRAHGWGFARVIYPGTYVYTLPPADAVTAWGGFPEAEVTFLPDRTTLRVKQAAGDRLRVYWEAAGTSELPAVEVQGPEVSVRGAGAWEGVVFWGRQQATLERAGPDRWKASRWVTLQADHPALAALRQTHPEAATILEDRPVVALHRGEGVGWLVVVGQEH